MQVENSGNENEQIIYTRVGPDQLRRFISRPVTLLGRVVAAAPRRVTIDIGNGSTNVTVENIDYNMDNPDLVLEVRGNLTSDRSIQAESWNIFEDKSFDLETFNKMLEHYHSQEYASLTLN